MNAAASSTRDENARAPIGANETGSAGGPSAGETTADAPLTDIAHEPSRDGEPESGAERDWTTRLAAAMHRSGGELGSRLHTTLFCEPRNARPMLFLPPEMGSLHPRSLVYLRAFSRRHGFGLIEDRRRVSIRPIVEQRGRTPSTLAMGISLLLGQTGMPGGARTLSNPHRLAADSVHVELDALVRMAALARAPSKRVVLLPNRLIAEATGSDTRPIVGRACRLETPGIATVLSQFESPSFRAVGYSTGRQYVVHVFLAGGLGAAPELWTRLHTLTHTDFRFRLFPGKCPAHDFGLLHATFHYDVAQGDDAPWWLPDDAAEPDETAHARLVG